MNEDTNLGNVGTQEVNTPAGGYQESTPAPQPAQAPQTQPSPTTADGSPSTFAIRVDQRTGRREIVSLINDDENTNRGTEQAIPAIPNMGGQQNQTQSQQQTQQPQMSVPLNIPQNLLNNNSQQELPKYANAGEIIAAINSGTIDENRIPIELAFQYAQFKQHVAQQQAINNQRKLEQQQQPLQQPNMQETVTPDVIKARQEYFSRVESMARANALQDLGLTEDELATAEYSDDTGLQERAAMFNTALQMHRNNILEAVKQQMAAQENAALAQRAIITNVNTQINQLSQTEPHFQGIIESMATLFKDKEIPFEKGVGYMLALNAYNNGSMTEQQANDLQEYYNVARKAYYAKINNIGQHNKSRVPYLEGSANSNNMQNNNFDKADLLKQLRTATDYRVKREIIGKLITR